MNVNNAVSSVSLHFDNGTQKCFTNYLNNGKNLFMKATNEQEINDLKKSIEEGTTDRKVYIRLGDIYSKQAKDIMKKRGDMAEINKLHEDAKNLYAKAMGWGPTKCSYKV